MDHEAEELRLWLRDAELQIERLRGRHERLRRRRGVRVALRLAAGLHGVRSLRIARPGDPRESGSGGDPERAALKSRVGALTDAGDLDAVEELLIAARSAQPGDAELAAMHAELAMSRGEWCLAKQRWRRVLTLFAGEGPEEAHARLAMVHRIEGDLTTARAVLDAAPPVSTASGSIAFAFERAAIATDEGDRAAAAEIWRHLLGDARLVAWQASLARSALTSTLRAAGLSLDDGLRPEQLIIEDHRRYDPALLASTRRAEAGSPEHSRLSCSLVVRAGSGDVEELRRTLESVWTGQDVVVDVRVAVLAGSDRIAMERKLQRGSRRRDRRAESNDTTRLELVVTEDPSTVLQTALDSATGDVLLLVEPGTVLAPGALGRLADVFATAPATDIVYADEDVRDTDGHHSDPLLKPSWDPDLLLGQPYLGHAVAFRMTAVRGAGGVTAPLERLSRPENRLTLMIWDLALRIVRRATPTQHASVARHLPGVLAHRGARSQRADWVAGPSWTGETDAALQIVHGDLADTPLEVAVTAAPWGVPLRVRPASEVEQLVASVIIPTRDRHELLEACVDGVLRAAEQARSSGLAVEIVIVDNDSVEQATVDLLRRIRASHDRVRIVPGPGEFNFSRLVNTGVDAASGDVCILLNNDVTSENDEWLEEMVGHAMRPEIGIVGALLSHEDGRVQHGGVIVGGNGTAEHAFREWPADAAGYLALLRSTRRVSAVTAACMAMRRSLYLELGGFDEELLPVELNDIDFCLRAGEAGLAVLWTPHARLRHREGGTRNGESGSRSLRPLLEQRARFVERWRHRLDVDPAYHPDLAMLGTTYLLRPTA